MDPPLGVCILNSLLNLLQEILTLYIPSIYRWRMTNAVEELKPSTTPHIIRIWNKVQQIRYNTISYLFIFSGILYMSFM